jgi:hypothetical protein
MSAEDDVKKAAAAAGRFLSKLGKSAKKAGQQVTGIGRGTVRVALDRTRFAPGDDVRGKVTLALPEGVEAKALTVTVRATQRAIDVHRSGGVRTVGTSTVTVYEQTQELGGARVYRNEELTFSVPLPKDANDRRAPAPSGALGDVARAVSSVVAPTTGPIQWRVTAALVVSWGRDLDHGVDIVVD